MVASAMSPALVFLLALLGTVDCGGHASIKSKYGQLVTSSTLRWRGTTAREFSLSVTPREAVRSGTGNQERVVCRADHHGATMLGQTVEGGHCAVAFINKLLKKSKFEILLNENLSAKLEWRPYTKYSSVPEGAVSGVDGGSDEQVFVGRHLSAADGRYLPGAISVPGASSSFSFGSMTTFDDANGLVSVDVSVGDVMVEVEPVRYELELVATPADQEKRPKVTRQDVVLAKNTLFRFDEGRDTEARLQKVLSYDYEKSEYYGQVPGTIRALSALVRTPNGQIQSILWGLPEKSKQKETLMVGHLLRHQSAVDVSVVGVRVTEEHSYRGTLTSVFPNGARRQRKVEGVVQRRYLNNIRAEYSRVYRIKASVTVNATKDTTTSTPYTPRFRETSTQWRTTTSSTTTTKREEAERSRGRERKKKDYMMSDASDKERQSAVISGSIDDGVGGSGCGASTGGGMFGVVVVSAAIAMAVAARQN